MVNPKVEQINMAEVFEARYVLQRRSDDHLIARDAVEPDHRSSNVADAFLAFRTQEEAEAFRREMRAEQFEIVELPPEVWLDACRCFLQEGLTYISLLELDGGTVAVPQFVAIVPKLVTFPMIVPQPFNVALLEMTRPLAKE